MTGIQSIFAGSPASNAAVNDEKIVIVDAGPMIENIGDLMETLAPHGISPDYVIDMALLAWSVCFYSCGPMLESFYYGECYEYVFERLREDGHITDDAFTGSLVLDNSMRICEMFYKHLNYTLATLMLSVPAGYYSYKGWVGKGLVLLLNEG